MHFICIRDFHLRGLSIFFPNEKLEFLLAFDYKMIIVLTRTYFIERFAVPIKLTNCKILIQSVVSNVLLGL